MRLSLAVAVLVVPSFVAAQAPVPVGSVKLTSTRTVAELDMGKLKGEPARLAWSPDGSELYVQTLEGGFGRPDAKPRHYSFNVETGAKKDLQAEPEWSIPYWAAKSHKASPDSASLQIALEQSTRTQRTTSAPMGGELARGGVGGETGTASSGTSVGDAASAAYGSQTVAVISTKLHGETIGEFVNSVFVPGLTFGWGPKGTRAIAYASPSNGRLVLMSVDGKKQELDGTKDALLPAWSQDGTRLAWLQRDGRKKFELRVAMVAS